MAGTNAANLRDAITGEDDEAETMYREFARRAKVVGDYAAASRFWEIRSDEAGHLAAVRAALATIEAGPDPGATNGLRGGPG